MKLAKRQARARRRAKSMRLVKKGVPHTCSKFSLHGVWKAPYGLTVRDWQSAKKKARRA